MIAIFIILIYAIMMFLTSVLLKVIDKCYDNNDMTSGALVWLSAIWPLTLLVILLFFVFILLGDLHDKIVNKITSMIQKD